MRKTILIVWWLSLGAVADMIPQASVGEMCYRAEAIVEGHWVKGDEVEIERVFLNSKWLRDNPTVTINRLGNHNRLAIHNHLIGLQSEQESITTRKFIAFLWFNPENEIWHSFHVNDQHSAIGKCGSSGIIWVADDTTYWYEQLDPGPLSLVQGPHPERIYEEIEFGLRAASEWRNVLNMRDPQMKATALSKYYLAHTSPAKDKGLYQNSFRFHQGTFRFYRRRVRNQMVRLAKDAVPAIERVLRKRQPGDDLNELVLTCAALRDTARPLAPLLADVLEEPEPPSHYYTLAALGKIGSEEAHFPKIRLYLTSGERQIRVAAAETLCLLKDQMSAPSIASLIESEAKAGRWHELRDLIRNLLQVDQREGGALVARLRKLYPNRDEIEEFEDE